MFAVVYIPDFSLQAVLRSDPQLSGQALALIDGDQPKSLVIQMTSAARASGVREGMSSTQALARCGSIIFKARSQLQENSAQQTVLQCAWLFSPFVESTVDGGCTLDLRGLAIAKPHSGAESSLGTWGSQIIEVLAKFHLRAQVGIGATPALAWHAANCAHSVLVVGNSKEFLDSLPIQSLPLSGDIPDILRKWGIQTVGQFLALGKERVAERLGMEGLRLFECGSADQMRPLKLAEPIEIFEEAKELENEIETLELLLFILRHFLGQISGRLELAGLVAEEITLTLNLSSGGSYERSLLIPDPTRDIDVLFRILHGSLENVKTDASIIGLRLQAKPGRPRQHQFGLFEATLRNPNHFYETIARLTALLGTDRVGTPVLESTHRPDAFRMEKVRFEETSARSNAAVQRVTVSVAGLALRRLRPALPVVVELSDKKPVSLKGSKYSGAIEKAAGPWRTSGSWWEKQWNRDEWDVQTRQGKLYRLYQENGAWFLEGVFD